jgi:hypothetical protein
MIWPLLHVSKWPIRMIGPDSLLLVVSQYLPVLHLSHLCCLLMGGLFASFVAECIWACLLLLASGKFFQMISALFMWVESIVGPSTEIFICWWFEQSEKKSSLIANLWPHHFTENLWVHFMHNGESLGGDCALSYRVREHSYLTTFVSPCFPHGCQSKQLVYNVDWAGCQMSNNANVKIWGKFVQDFCPNIVQLQHSPTLCSCDTGTIPKCLFFCT